jgi:hypothetical protein
MTRIEFTLRAPDGALHTVTLLGETLPSHAYMPYIGNVIALRMPVMMAVEHVRCVEVPDESDEYDFGVARGCAWCLAIYAAVALVCVVVAVFRGGK